MIIKLVSKKASKKDNFQVMKNAQNRNDLGIFYVAGEEGFEPSAYGFGDRRSTS